MEVIKANELGDQARKEISDIFVGGFIKWLGFFSKDEERLSKAFSHMFLLEKFYVAIVEGEVAGIVACTDGLQAPIHLNPKELRRHLGLVKGTIAGIVLKKELENHHYPFVIEPGCGSVEFVATGSDFRGKGVATTIIRRIFETTDYNNYVLEVADTNTSAVKLYEKLGFREFARIPQKHSKQTGINDLVYMRYYK